MTNTFILNDTRRQLHHGCNIVMRNLVMGLERRGAKIVGTLGCGLRLRRGTTAYREFMGAERIVINGEGTIHDCRPNARYLLELGALAVAAGKKVYLVNSTWESNSDEFAKLLQGFASIWVRDSTSADALLAQNVGAAVAPDLTFLSSYPVGQVALNEIQVTDSVYDDTSSSLNRLAKSRNWLYMPITVCPTLRGPRRNASRWLRTQCWNALQCCSLQTIQAPRRYADLRHCEPHTDRYLNRLAQSRFVVAGRFHAVCLALQNRVPFVAVPSNTSKIESLLHDAGIDAGRRVRSISAIGELDESAVTHLASYLPAEERALERFLTAAAGHCNAMLDQVMHASGSAH